jgi:hypothetical protein
MHQPKVGIGTRILLVSYVGSYRLFSIPHPPEMQPMLCSCSIQMNDTTCKRNNNHNKGNDNCSVLVNDTTCKGNNNRTKGMTIVPLGQTNVVLIAL